MPDRESTAYLVDTDDDPVVLRIHGRASYLNCAPVRKLFDMLLGGGHKAFLVDFHDCTGMDSTFLGILAGIAIEVRKANPPGHMTLCRLNKRNMELVHNLGLHHILYATSAGGEDLREGHVLSENGAEAAADMILDAHQKLMEADAGNIERFQDVVAFLKKRVEQD